MRIVAIGDTHTQHNNIKVPEGDVLLFAGDGEFRSILDLVNFNRWLSGLKHKHIIVIAGNHDFFCEKHPDEIKLYFTEAVYLRNERYELPNGMALWGSPMTRTFMDWAFMDTEENLDRNYWSKIPKSTDLLLVHGPAYGHLDTAVPGGASLGSKSLAKRMRKLKIPYVVFGHIHGSYGIKKTGDSAYINCSVLDEDYQLVNKPVVVDI
ncbi:MAG: metallophosphatase domain-containing protein [Candidatus Omnitrophica bacterium]|nr:metallophosphatase domain-containing protein [Candidatus Omnitrophota bacterium]